MPQGYDYKWAIQERAEELAMELHDKEFYELNDEDQMKVYTAAMERERDHLFGLADGR